ncbi:type I secretion outer membrane protein, TolC family [Herbaspirillum sp. YR522]|nr:type I secretion outer membrane protein, TolC family [Herbaspirillum sp. YR522]
MVWGHRIQLRIQCVMLPLAIVVILGNSAYAAGPLDFYERAKRDDPTFEAAQFELESAKERIPQARAGLLPSVIASGGRSRSHGQYSFNQDVPSDRNVGAWNWTVQLTQPLLRAQNWASYSQAEAMVAQAEAKFIQARQDLILRIAQAYFDFDTARESLIVAQAQVVAVDQQLNMAKRGFQAGTNTITDVHESKARYDLGQSQKIAAENDLINKKEELEKIVGAFKEPVDSLNAQAVLMTPEPADAEAWAGIARDSSPQVLQQQAAINAAEKEIARNKAGYLPTVDLVGSYGRNFSSGSSNTPTDYETRTRSNQIGIQVNIPIFSGGETNSRVRQAVAELYRARAEFRVAQRGANAAARQAFFAIASGKSQVDALQSAVDSSRNAVKANQVGYRLGTRIMVDVLNAQQQLYTAQRDLVKAKYDVLLQSLKLRAAAGTLSEDDVINLNRLFVE